MENNNQELTMEKFMDEINEKYAAPKEAFDKAYNEYIDILVDLQTVLSVGLENRTLLMTTDNTNNILSIIHRIEESDLVKTFEKVEGSPVTNTVRVALALWDSTCYTIGRYISNEMDKKDTDDKSGVVLHVTASIIAVFELLHHAVSFANFEDTIDKAEYMELFTKFQSMIETEPLTAIVDSDKKEDE